MVVLRISSLAAFVSPRDARVDFVGDVVVILLLSEHDENKLKKSEDHMAQALAMR